MKEYLPQFIYLALTMLGLGVNLANDGKSQEPHNFSKTLFATVFTLALLLWGGFFDGFMNLI